MTGQNILVYKRFYHRIFQILVYFLSKSCNSLPQKGHPVFPSNPPLKIEVVPSLLLFENLVGGTTPSPPALAERGRGRGGVHTMPSTGVKNSCSEKIQKIHKILRKVSVRNSFPQ